MSVTLWTLFKILKNQAHLCAKIWKDSVKKNDTPVVSEANLIKCTIIIGVNLLHVVPSPAPSLLFVGRGGETVTKLYNLFCSLHQVYLV
jgi:hypothetical protein